MSNFYDNIAITAAALISDKGQTVSFSRQTGGTFDPVLGSESGASTTAFSGKAVALSYNKLEIDGTVILRGDVKLVLEATDTEPAANDECTVDSIVYRVMAVEPISPGGTTVINKVQLRR